MRALLSALLFAATAASAYEVKLDSTGSMVSWKAPVRFIVDEKLADRLHAEGADLAVRAAISTITASVPALKVDAVAGKVQEVGYDFEHPEKSASNVVAPAAWKFNKDAVATTVVTVSTRTHAILEADIAFNVEHTGFAVVNGVEATRYDVQNAMTHELGHAFGLAHNAADPHSVMFPASVPGEISKRALNADDLDGLRFLYGAVADALDPEAPVRGCSATGTAPFAMLALGMVLLRRRKAALALASVLGLLGVVPAFASSAAPKPWVVEAVVTNPPGHGPCVLQSEVTFVRGAQTVRVTMAGGRWGDLEQIVEGEAVPQLGQTVFEISR